MDADGGSCFPSLRTLASEVGVGRSTVQRHLEQAAEDGWIERYSRGLGGQAWRRSGYRAALPQAVPLKRDTSEKRCPISGEKVSHLGGTEDVTEDVTTIGASEEPLSPPRGAYPTPFRRFWAAYPRRAGGNSKKAAYRKWQATLRKGATADELEDVASRYAAYCDATETTGTRYVKQAATFLGPDEHWREEWAVPSKNGPDPERLANLGRLARQVRL